ncbi:hypothetical protein F4553_005228 [Allocatelliglobosispora scoriae]|uniref:Uncharacterized protein n=1 Tax=Allocatelliglobosispora scoriae TaxID=643052 RepID=A0A841BXH7_9ACTN|nr:hypothetical protein [Allocatelliglobosispora scoriae]MBB5871849.1 hypothetical protein [Allocatelliglobosispora scoriae]
MFELFRKFTATRDAAILESVRFCDGAEQPVSLPSDRAAAARDRAEQRAYLIGIRL